MKNVLHGTTESSSQKALPLEAVFILVLSRRLTCHLTEKGRILCQRTLHPSLIHAQTSSLISRPSVQF
jgi:hypothetical protein